MNDLLGVVLAGGQSRRFGAPKAAAVLGGRNLQQRALRALVPVTADRAVAKAQPDAQSDAGSDADAAVLHDRRPSAGPLGGVESALGSAAERGLAGVVVLACDLPGVTWPVLASLVGRWRSTPEPRTAAVALGEGDDLQPLCAVYGVDLLGGLGSFLDERPEGAGRSARGWWQTLAGGVEVAASVVARETGLDEDDLLLNVNEPGDLARAARLPAPPPPLVSVTGWKDTGKTTVAVALTAALVERGLRVYAFKHGHGFELDTPGTDSWRLRHEGGAARVMLAGPEGEALFGDWGPEGEPGLAALVARHGAGADLVVAEGWKHAPVPSIEVHGPDDSGRSARCIAVVARQGGGEGGPPRFDPDDPDLGRRLADLVADRLLPSEAA